MLCLGLFLCPERCVVLKLAVQISGRSRCKFQRVVDVETMLFIQTKPTCQSQQNAGDCSGIRCRSHVQASARRAWRLGASRGKEGEETREGGGEEREGGGQEPPPPPPPPPPPHSRSPRSSSSSGPICGMWPGGDVGTEIVGIGIERTAAVSPSHG